MRGDRRPLLRSAAALALATGLGRCAVVDGGCTLQYRFGEWAGVLAPAPGASPADSAVVFMDQFRGSDDQRMMGWRVGAAGVADSVTAIHLHDARDGSLLLSIAPVRIAGNVALTNLPPGPPYDGSIPYEQLFGRLDDGVVYLDVHTAASGTAPVRRAELRQRNGRGWNDACTD
ncbi:MAG TPA: hypothetical protein VF541_00130 [Longimicrobium sp.]